LSLYTENDADRYLCWVNLAIVESELEIQPKSSLIQESVGTYRRSHILAADKYRKHPSRLYYLMRKKAEILLKMNALPEATLNFKIYLRKKKTTSSPTLHT
jgi:hypothetical protein